MELLAVTVMALGVLVVLRAVLVTLRGQPAFRGDEFVSVTVGFSLVLLGRLLLG